MENKENIKKVGRPKGTKNSPGHGAGNPRIGRHRNKAFSIKLTEDELREVKKKFEEIEGENNSDKLLNLLKIN